MKLNKKAR